MKTTAPAKINPYIRVVGTRSDGMHEIETVFLPLDQPRDEIRLTEAEAMAIESNHPDLPLAESNLCWKAAVSYANTVEELAGRPFDKAWTIAIEKRIPIAAGLGGGSSDAAAVLNLLNAKYAALPPKRLKRLARDLGADVPFFLNPGPALASGIGEKLEPVPVGKPRPVILIVAPMFPVRAAWAYKKHDERLRKELDSHANDHAIDATLTALKRGDWQALGQTLRNDLAPALYDKFPLLCELRDFLRKDGIHGAEISGSGPTLFAVCENANVAETTGKTINDEFGEALQCLVTSIANDETTSN